MSRGLAFMLRFFLADHHPRHVSSLIVCPIPDPPSAEHMWRYCLPPCARGVLNVGIAVVVAVMVVAVALGGKEFPGL